MKCATSFCRRQPLYLPFPGLLLTDLCRVGPLNTAISSGALEDNDSKRSSHVCQPREAVYETLERGRKRMAPTRANALSLSKEIARSLEKKPICGEVGQCGACSKQHHAACSMQTSSWQGMCTHTSHIIILVKVAWGLGRGSYLCKVHPPRKPFSWIGTE